MPIKNWRRIGIPYRHDIGMILKRSRALSKGAMFSTGSGEQIVPEEAQHAETQRSSTSSFHWTHTAADRTQLFHLAEYGPRVPESSRGGGHRLANTRRVDELRLQQELFGGAVPATFAWRKNPQ